MEVPDPILNRRRYSLNYIEIYRSLKNCIKLTTLCEHYVTNISYFDSNYWKALFEDFYYPDGTKPEWEAIDYLQRLFIHWFNKERTKVILTFPVNNNCGIIK